MTSLGPSDGRLIVTTGVTGPGSRMGHRLTIAMNLRQATVSWADDGTVVSGTDGGRGVARDRARRGRGHATVGAGESVGTLECAENPLEQPRFPTIAFRADEIDKTTDGYRLTGTLQIHGKTRPRVIDLRVEDLDGTSACRRARLRFANRSSASSRTRCSWAP